jgi:hypothetical protein
MIYFTKIVFAGLFMQAGIVVSDASLLPPNFSWWFWQSCEATLPVLTCSCLLLLLAIVVGSRLYIDGGEIWARWGGAVTDSSAVWST